RYELARWSGEAGDAAEAVAACEDVLTDQSRVLGPDHPSTLATRAGLASLLGKARGPAHAVAEYDAVLADQLRVLGPDHPSTATVHRELVRWRDRLSR
ncbi:tetratricopeptide repeat protein, partial [Lentzea sp.]|uniref:tetratricopeptide repeat protein n=1 Tax=Lentzea sp. TaxID=56099 RepID=UPI002ED52014